MNIVLHELADNLKWLIIPILLLGVHQRQKLPQRWKIVWLGLVLVTILYASTKLLLLMYTQVIALPEWDFRWFWIQGRVAAQGLNFVDPTHARQLAQSLDSTPEFISQLDFPYLPPTIFLFAWLGWFDVQTAYLFWYGVHGIILLVDIFLLWRIFLARSRLIHLLLVAALMFSLPATYDTLKYGQTNFLVLLLLLLFWSNRQRWQGGIWLGLGLLTKPFLGLMLLYSLLHRHWRVMFSMTIVLVIASLLTIIVFGTAPFSSYFSPQLGTDRPDSVYVESVNQSLLATVLRLTHYDFSQTSPLTQPLFIALAIGLIGITVWLIHRLAHHGGDWALAMTLLTSLLLYPGTLTHYSVHLIISILLLWKYRNQSVFPVWSIIVFITLQYILTNYEYGTFLAFLLSWLVVVRMAVWQLAQSASDIGNPLLSD